MNVAVINDYTKFSGIGRYSSNLSYATNAQLISIVKDPSKLNAEYSGKVFTGFSFPPITTGWYLNQNYPDIFLKKVSNYLKEKLPSGGIIHYASQSLVPFNLSFNEVSTIHDLMAINPRYKNPNMYIKIMKKALNRLEKLRNIITDSAYVRKQLIEYGFSGEIEIIYPPVQDSFKKLTLDKNSLRKKLGLPLDKKLVLNVSTSRPWKNLKAVEETMNLLGEEYRLVRVGEPFQSSYSFNKISDKDLNEIYNSCDVMLFPSIDEGFGYPIAESFSVGLPVVCSDIEVFRETAINAAILCEPRPLELKKSIIEALASSEELSKKGLAIAPKYSYETFEARIKSYYKKNFKL